MKKLSLLAIFLLISCASTSTSIQVDNNKIENEQLKPNDFVLKCQSYNQYSKNNRGVDEYWQYDAQTEILNGVAYNYEGMSELKKIEEKNFKLKNVSEGYLEFENNDYRCTTCGKTIFIDRKDLRIEHWSNHFSMPCEFASLDDIEKEEKEYQKKLIELEERPRKL